MTPAKSGQILFGIAMVGIGIVNLIFGDFLAGLIPVSPAAPGRQFFMYVVSVLLIGSGVAIVLEKQLWIAAITLAVLFFVLLLLVHLPRNMTNLYDGGAWTGTFEMLALCSGALIIADTLPGDLRARSGWNFLIRAGRYLYAISLAVFSFQHFIYADFIATLIPTWIPARLFWAYFVGGAFIASAMSIVLNKKLSLAMILLTTMFFLWVLVLHVPRVMASPQHEPEWTSALVALTMGAIALMIHPKH
jgi:uncharacterized membrane protein YphA (DoxX/SURF4 family)